MIKKNLIVPVLFKFVLILFTPFQYASYNFSPHKNKEITENHCLMNEKDDLNNIIVMKRFFKKWLNAQLPQELITIIFYYYYSSFLQMYNEYIQDPNRLLTSEIITKIKNNTEISIDDNNTPYPNYTFYLQKDCLTNTISVTYKKNNFGKIYSTPLFTLHNNIKDLLGKCDHHYIIFTLSPSYLFIKFTIYVKRRPYEFLYVITIEPQQENLTDVDPFHFSPQIVCTPNKDITNIVKWFINNNKIIIITRNKTSSSYHISKINLNGSSDTTILPIKNSVCISIFHKDNLMYIKGENHKSAVMICVLSTDPCDTFDQLFLKFFLIELDDQKNAQKKPIVEIYNNDCLKDYFKIMYITTSQ